MNHVDDHRDEVHLEGHLIDSLLMARMRDKIVELGGDFEILDFKRRSQPRSRTDQFACIAESVRRDRLIHGSFTFDEAQ